MRSLKKAFKLAVICFVCVYHFSGALRAEGECARAGACQTVITGLMG